MFETKKYTSTTRKIRWSQYGFCVSWLKNSVIVAVLGLCGIFHPSFAPPANADTATLDESVDLASGRPTRGRMSFGLQGHMLSNQGIRPYGWISLDHEIPSSEGLTREVGISVTALSRFGLKEVAPELHYLARNDVHEGFRAALQIAPGLKILPRFMVEGEGMFELRPRFSSFVGGRLQYFEAASGASIWFGTEWGFQRGWSLWGRMLLSAMGFRPIRKTQLFPATQFRLYRYFSDDLIAYVGLSYGQEGFVQTFPPSVGFVASRGGGFGMRYRFHSNWEAGGMIDTQYRGDQPIKWWTTVGTELRYFFR